MFADILLLTKTSIYSVYKQASLRKVNDMRVQKYNMQCFIIEK